jgi:tetratricopeptide (TPR) repeat protein
LQEQHSKASEAYSRALKMKPKSKEVRKKYLKFITKMKQGEEKKKAYQSLVAISPGTHQAHYQLARIFLKEKNRASAYRHLMKALKSQPKKEKYLKLLPKVVKSDQEIKDNLDRLKALDKKPGTTARIKMLLARAFAIQKKPGEAAKYYKQAYSLDKNALKGEKKPVEILYAGKKYSLAGTLARDYLKSKDPKDRKICEIQVKSYEKSGVEKKKLRAAMGNLVALDPQTRDWWLKLARLDLAAGDTAAAIRHAKTWTQRRPGSIKGYKFLEPLVAKRKKEIKTYAVVLSKLIKLEPKTANPRIRKLGFLRFKQKKDVEAEALLKKAGAAFPKDAKLWFTLGRLHDKKAFKGSGKEDYKKAYALSPENIKYARAYGKALKSNAGLKQNLKLFQLLIKHSPSVDERIKLAKSYYLNKEYASSAMEWQTLMKMNPALTAAEPMALAAFIKSGKSEWVRSIYEKKLAENPGNLRVLDTLCSIYKNAKMNKKYRATLGKIVSLDAGYKKFQLELARLLLKSRDTSRAVKQFRQWTSRNPGDKKALTTLFHLDSKARDTTQLLGTLKKLVAIKGADSKYRYLLAEINMKKYSRTEGLQRLIKKDPDYVYGRKLLTWHYYSKNQITNLLPLAAFLRSEAGRDKTLLSPLAEVQASKKQYTKANASFYQALKLRRKDRKFYDRVLSFSRKHKSPHLRAVLKMGYESFPDDVEIKYQYAMSLGKTDKALRVLQELLKQKSRHLKGVKAAANISLYLKKTDQAVKWLEQWGKLSSKEKKPWKELDKIYSARKDSARMVKVLEKLANISPNDHKLHYRIGMSCQSMGEKGKALKYLQKAAELGPSTKKYQRSYGLALAAEGKMKKAKKPLLAAYSEKKLDGEISYALYHVYTEEKNQKAARKELRRLVKSRPHDKKFAYPLAKLEVELKNPQRAITILEHPELKPALNAEMSCLLVLQYIKAGAKDKAAKLGMQIAREYPEEAPLELAVFFFKRRIYATSKKLLDHQIDNTSTPEAFYYRARIAFSEKSWKTAVKYFKKAKKFSPESHSYMGRAYVNMRDYSNAAKAYEEYYDEKKTKDLLVKLYDLYKKAKDDRGTVDILERLIEAYPKSIRYHKALADAYLAAGKSGKANEQFLLILKKDPNDRKANLYGGMALARDNKCRQAIVRLRMGLKGYPKNAEAWELMGDCYKAMNNKNSAKRAYRKAEKLKAGK